VRIAAVDVFAVDLTPVAGDFRLSRGRTMRASPSWVVRVTADDGRRGWGEACPLTSAYLPTFTGAVGAALAELAPALLGADPRALGAVEARMEATLMGQEAARSPLDVACWDLLGQAAGLPVVMLLGGRLSDELPLYEAIPMGSAAETAERVERALAAGVRRFQLKVGGDPRVDAATVERVVEQAGEGAVVIADANGGWSLADALVAVRALEDLPVFLEQPCRRLEDVLHVRAATALPLILDESVTDADSLVAAVRRAGASGVNLKIGKVGGLTPARRLRDLAVSLGASVTIEDTWGGDVAAAAIAHLAASTPPASLFSVSLVNAAVAEHVAGGEPVDRAPDGPGLGLRVDESLLGDPVMSFRA